MNGQIMTISMYLQETDTMRLRSQLTVLSSIKSLHSQMQRVDGMRKMDTRVHEVRLQRFSLMSSMG